MLKRTSREWEGPDVARAPHFSEKTSANTQALHLNAKHKVRERGHAAGNQTKSRITAAGSAAESGMTPEEQMALFWSKNGLLYATVDSVNPMVLLPA